MDVLEGQKPRVSLICRSGIVQLLANGAMLPDMVVLRQG